MFWFGLLHSFILLWDRRVGFLSGFGFFRLFVSHSTVALGSPHVLLFSLSFLFSVESNEKEGEVGCRSRTAEILNEREMSTLPSP